MYKHDITSKFITALILQGLDTTTHPPNFVFVPTFVWPECRKSLLDLRKLVMQASLQQIEMQWNFSQVHVFPTFLGEML